MPNYTLNSERTPDGNARDNMVPDKTIDEMIGNTEDIESKVNTVDSIVDALTANLALVNADLMTSPEWYGQALEDGGYEIAGCTLPDFNGSYYAIGSLNSDFVYQNKDGAGFLWWDGVDSWIISAVNGTAGTDHFIRANASAVGAFTNEGEATGTVTGADIVDAVHLADRIGADVVAFQIDAGNEVWGSWVQIFGSDDETLLNLNSLLVTASEQEAPYMIQFGTGAAGSQVFNSEIVVNLNSGKEILSPIKMQADALVSGGILWARCLAVGMNTGTLDFYLSVN